MIWSRNFSFVARSRYQEGRAWLCFGLVDPSSPWLEWAGRELGLMVFLSL